MLKVEEKTLKPVIANRGVEMHYRRAMQELIAEMQGSVMYWTEAAYKKFPPRMLALNNEIATDAAPHTRSERINRILKELADRWTKKFAISADKIAESYLRSMYNASDNSLRQALKEAGISVKFSMTPTVRDAFTASVEENVSLIKSIPSEYFPQVNGIVMRTYSTGRDLHKMTQELKELYPKAADRAETIARDQSNKANATITRARQMELGITEGIWMHSSAGKVPRPSHVQAGKDKRRFNLAEGCLIEGEHILPGQKINCRCSWRAVLPYGA